MFSLGLFGCGLKEEEVKGTEKEKKKKLFI